jgi:UDP-N-acetyl-D-glucosamine dehydrogenase
MEELAAQGANLAYHDPYVPALPELGLQNQPLEETLSGADAVVLITAHPNTDHAAIAADSSLFIDLRGITRGLPLANVLRL